MLSRFRQWMTDTFFPLKAIAEELRILRELYELDLGAKTDHLGRPTPIYRVTEAPNRLDTQVTFAGSERPSSEDIFAEALDQD